MKIALWIIAVVETIRMIEQTFQLRLIAKDTGARDNAYAEFVKSLKMSDREFVQRMLEEMDEYYHDHDEFYEPQMEGSE